MLKYSQSLMGLGEAHLAMIALGASSRNLIYGGENLSLISQSMSDRTKMIVSEAAVQNMRTQSSGVMYPLTYSAVAISNQFFSPLGQAQ